MAGTGLYKVGLNQTYTTLQDAIDALVSDQGASAFTSEQKILVTDDRTYSGCSIPNTLNPTSSFRLIIEAAAGASPVISGTVDSSKAWIGVLVDTVSYVTIRGFKITKFNSAGVVFSTSDYCQVDRCKIEKNINFGVQFWRSNYGDIVDTSIQIAANPISIVRSKNIVIRQTSVYSERYCLRADFYPELEGEALNIEDPIFYAFNSIFVSVKTACLEMGLDHEKTLKCNDGNVYWSGVGAIANLYQTVNGKRVDTLITTISKWRRVTRSESTSAFVDPEFITDYTGKPASGLTLESTSPVANLGLSTDALAACIPSWLTISNTESDSEDRPRDNVSPTPGANEVLTNFDYDYISFATGTSQALSTSEYLVDGPDSAVRQLAKSIDFPYPKVAADYFNIGDASFFLYAAKYARYLRDITWTKVELSQRMIVSNVRIGDTSTTDDIDLPTVEWFKQGDYVWASHKGLSFNTPYTESVRVYGTATTWDSSNQEFNNTPTEEYFSIKKSEQEFFLLSPDLHGSPVVITDDTISGDSSRDIVPMEYSLNWRDDLGKMEVVLQGNLNLFENPHFHNLGSGWLNSNVTMNYKTDTSGLVGEAYAQCITPNDPGDNYFLRQDVYRLETEKDLLFSFYMRSDSGGSYTPVITTYDSAGVFQTSQVVGTISGSVATSDIGWDRYLVFCKARDESQLSPYGATYVESFEATLKTLDDETASRVTFELRATRGGTSEFDAMSAVEGSILEKYAGCPYGTQMTIEWESSDYKVYDIDDLSLSPINNPQHSGFLTVPNVRLSNIQTSLLDNSHTTLSDTYPSGRIDIIPWARLDGPNKLYSVENSNFNLESVGLPREVGFLPQTSQASSIDGPSIIEVGAGLEKSFTINFTDQFDNPYAYEQVTATIYEDSGRYPGMIGIRELGSPSIFNTTVTARTDSAGSLTGVIVSPDARDIQINLATSELSSSISTYYRISASNHGNVSMRVALNNTAIDTKGSETSEDYSLTKLGSKYYADTVKIPAFATAKVYVPGTSSYDVALCESLRSDIRPQEFYIDYATGRVYLTDDHKTNVRILYRPLLATIQTSDPSVLLLDSSLTAAITSDVIIDHDAYVTISVTAGAITENFPVVIRNPYK